MKRVAVYIFLLAFVTLYTTMVIMIPDVKHDVGEVESINTTLRGREYATVELQSGGRINVSLDHVEGDIRQFDAVDVMIKDRQVYITGVRE